MRGRLARAREWGEHSHTTAQMHRSFTDGLPQVWRTLDVVLTYSLRGLLCAKRAHSQQALAYRQAVT